MERNLSERIGDGLFLRFGWLWPTILVLAAVPAVLGVGSIGIDSSNESFMPKDDPVSRKNDQFKEIFGSEEFFYILVESDEIYRRDTLNAISALEDDLRENLPFLDDITSIVSAESLEADEGFLSVDSLEDRGIPADPDELSRIRRRHLDSLLFPGRILSQDGSSAGIMVSLQSLPREIWACVEPGYSPLDEAYMVRDRAVLREDLAPEPGDEGSWIRVEDPRKVVTATLLALLEDHEADDFDIHLTGMPYIDHQVDVVTTSETSFFGLLSLSAAVLLLIAVFREIRAILAPLSVFGLTLTYVFGFMGGAGMKLSIMTIVLIPLLLVIAIGYSIHMIHQIRRGLRAGLPRREALVKAYGYSAWPCLLTAVTTAAGFLSFLFVPIGPIRELGLLSAVGAMIAFLLVMILVPLIYRIPAAKRNRHSPRRAVDGIGSDGWDRWNRWLYRNSVGVFLAAGAVAAASLVGALRIRSSSDMMEMIGEEAGFVAEAQYVSRHLGGAYSTEFLIELPREGLAKDPRVLDVLRRASDRAAEYEEVSLTLSLSDLVLELDRVLKGKAKDEAGIPNDQSAVAQYLLLYEMAGGDALSDWTDYEYRTLRLSALQGSARSDFGAFARDIGGFLEANMPAGTVVTVTGDMPVMMRMMDLIVDSQIRSCLAALAFIALLLLLILRNLRLGLLAVVPNLFPILTSLGLMGWLGYRLDFVTAMVAPMLIGIAVDDTVHFFVHYKDLRRSAADAAGASLVTFRAVGKALVATSIVLAGGFILFSFSSMLSLRHLGVLASTGIVSALAADMLLSPLLLSAFERKSRRNLQEVINEIA